MRQFVRKKKLNWFSIRVLFTTSSFFTILNQNLRWDCENVKNYMHENQNQINQLSNAKKALKMNFFTRLLSVLKSAFKHESNKIFILHFIFPENTFFDSICWKSVLFGQALVRKLYVNSFVWWIGKKCQVLCVLYTQLR